MLKREQPQEDVIELKNSEIDSKEGGAYKTIGSVKQIIRASISISEVGRQRIRAKTVCYSTDNQPISDVSSRIRLACAAH